MDACSSGVVAALVARDVLVACETGPSLADLRHARVPLTDGEAATVVIALAQSLDELHDAGLAYGPPSADVIRFAPGGRPVLVVPPAWAVAPDDDVPGLLRTVVAAMGPALPRRPVADEEADGPELRGLLEGLLSRGCRDGAEVVRECFAAVEPEAVRLPDAGALARAALLAPVPAAPPIPPARLPRAVPPSRAAARAPAGTPAPVGRRALRRRTRWRRRLRIGSALVAALALVAGAAMLRPAAERANAGPVEAPTGPLADPVLDRRDPAAAAAVLTRRRAAVLGAGDAARLDAVDAAGGPALDADEDLLAALGGDRLEGLGVDVGARSVTGGSGRDESFVSVTSAMSPYRRVGASGAWAVPGTAPRTVVLHLRWTDAGWRVWDVTDPSPSS